MEPDPNIHTGEYIPGAGRQRQSGWHGFNARLIRGPTYSAFGFGTMLAIAVSYVHNQSIGWAIVHGLLSWFYVIYAALFY